MSTSYNIMSDEQYAAIPEHDGEGPRTPAQIYKQTMELARGMYRQAGYVDSRVNPMFHCSYHPQERRMWEAAVLAQEVLTGTEVLPEFGEEDYEE